MTPTLAEVMALADGYANFADGGRAALETSITSLLDALEEAQRDARRMREWLNHNTTFYNTAESSAPVLASVSKRIWYHATDDMESYPFDAVADAAIAEMQQENKPHEG